MKCVPALGRSSTTRSRAATSWPRLSAAAARARIRNEVLAGQANVRPETLSKRGSWTARTTAAGPLLSADRLRLAALDRVEQLLLLSIELHRRSRTNGTFSCRGIPEVTLEPLAETLAGLRGDSGRREWSPFREELTGEDQASQRSPPRFSVREKKLPHCVAPGTPESLVSP
jgi:hypothetical protein